MAADRLPHRWIGRINVLGLTTMVGVAALWEVLVRADVIHFRFVPPPSAIAGHVNELLSGTPFFGSLGHTVAVTVGGWLIAGVVGIALGATLGLSSVARRWSMTTVDLLRALPAVAFVPVAVLIFGFSYRTELMMAVYVAFWPVVINTAAGVRNVSPVIRDVSRTFRMTRSEVLRKVILPSAAPDVLVGLRLALTLSLVLTVAAEMVGSPAGLGYQLVQQQQALQPELMFGYVITTGLVGLALNAAFLLCVRAGVPGLARASGLVERA